MDLLKAIFIATNCNSAEEIKNLPQQEKLNLANLLEDRLPSGMASSDEWNEVLRLIMGAPPEKDALAAKKKFLRYLRGAVSEEPTKRRWWKRK